MSKFVSNTRGFSLVLDNGYTVSVHWDWINDCDNKKVIDTPLHCKNAEVAYWKRDELTEVIRGYVSVEEALKIIEEVRSLT
jgi:hypothetical protein